MYRKEQRYLKTIPKNFNNTYQICKLIIISEQHKAQLVDIQNRAIKLKKKNHVQKGYFQCQDSTICQFGVRVRIHIIWSYSLFIFFNGIGFVSSSFLLSLNNLQAKERVQSCMFQVLTQNHVNSQEPTIYQCSSMEDLLRWGEEDNE